MSKFLIHILCGPDLKNKATLASLFIIITSKYVLKENNVKLYVSGMSAKARGYDDSLLDDFNAEFAMPDKLLELSTDSNAVLCY